MKTQDYTVSITVPAGAEAAYHAINNIKAWWCTHFEGQSEKLNDVFTVDFGETYITIQLVELVPFTKIGWQVIDCHKHWLKNKKEWKDTTMQWEISAENNTTTITFTHLGLVPGIECYKGCEVAWNEYITESLYQLLTDGTGKPS